MPRRLASSPSRSDPPKKAGRRITLKDDIEAAILEFCGTFMFLLLALGGSQAVSSAAEVGPEPSSVIRYLYISVVFGLSLLISAWLFFRITGGLFNPNVSLALVLSGIISPVRFVLFCIAQLVGAIAAAAVVIGLTPGPLASNTRLSTGINSAQGVFIEMFITAALCLSVLMLGVEKHQATPFAPVGVGLTLFACHLFAVPYTGAGMNTARSFGPAAVTGFHYSKHWIYWVGPALGSLLAAAFYYLLKSFRYWRLNPGQDSIDVNDTPGAAPSTAEREAGLANGGTDGRGGSVNGPTGRRKEIPRDVEAQV